MSLITPLVFDPSLLVDCYARINRDGVAQTLIFSTSDGTPYVVNTKTWQLNIKQSSNETTNLLQLLSGSGLTITETSIIIAPSAAQTATMPERGFYYELYNLTDKQTWLSGTFYFYKGKFNNVITPGANTITITVSNGTPINIDGGSANAVYTGSNQVIDGGDA